MFGFVLGSECVTREIFMGNTGILVLNCFGVTAVVFGVSDICSFLLSLTEVLLHN